VSPRGVAIPDVEEQLFQAAERVLFRDGPDGLTGRAITDEAGVAKGLLYNHFSDLDEFLAELIVDRARAAADEASRLPQSAGSGTVGGNLTDAAVTLLRSHAFAIAGIVHSRPGLMGRLHDHPVTTLDGVEAAFAEYLAGERRLGRVAADADVEAFALILVGTLHHLFMTQRTSSPSLRKQIRRIVDALLAGRESREPH
jgi:AcrR family transcriptional regulator